MLYALQEGLTILRDLQSPEPTADPQTLALAALGWILSDGDRAQRFLALTGLTPDALRAGLGDPALLSGVFEFLAAHEPDMVAAAHALDLSPQKLADAGRSFAS
jgi:hypothetical protein